jgi:DNA-binding GntR family transcriptional regulator
MQGTRQGTPVAELARQYGISRQRVREIVRSEEFWIARTGLDGASTSPIAPPRLGTFRDLRELPAAIPRTRRMLVDP